MVSIVWVQFLRFVRVFFQKVCKDSFLSCIQSSFVSFLKLQKILNYTPHCWVSVSMGTRKNRWGLFAGGRRTRSVEKVVKLSGRQFLSESSFVGVEGRSRVQIDFSHKLSVLLSNSLSAIQDQDPSNDNPIDDDDSSRTTRHTKSNQNRFSLSVSNQLLVFLFRHCFRSSFFHVLFVSVCIFRF